MAMAGSTAPTQRSVEQRATWHDVKKILFGKGYKAVDSLIIGGLVTGGLGALLLIGGLILMIGEHARHVSTTTAVINCAQNSCSRALFPVNLQFDYFSMLEHQPQRMTLICGVVMIVSGATGILLRLTFFRPRLCPQCCPKHRPWPFRKRKTKSPPASAAAARPSAVPVTVTPASAAAIELDVVSGDVQIDVEEAEVPSAIIIAQPQPSSTTIEEGGYLSTSL